MIVQPREITVKRSREGGVVKVEVAMVIDMPADTSSNLARILSTNVLNISSADFEACAREDPI